MMRLLPRSLFWRMMLILIMGLVLAQIIGSSILLRDRGNVIKQNLGLHLINRISAVVQLVEQADPQKRQDIVRVFDTPEFRVSISEQPRPKQEDAISPLPLLGMLRRSLPRHNDATISIIPMHHQYERWHKESRHKERRHKERRRDEWRDRPPKKERREFRPRGPMPLDRVGFEAQVQLSDGNWLIIHRPVPDDIYKWRSKILSYLAILVLSIALLSYVAVRFVTKPLGVLADAADDLGKNIQSPPLDEKGPAEVRRAAKAFNNMQTRLRRYIEDRGEILAAVSHDLKTPITRLRLRTEMLEDEKAQGKFNQDLDDMEQMVLATLDFMRGTESSEKAVPIDILAMLEALQEDMQSLGHKVEIEQADIDPYVGRPLLLKRCITNLVENAVRYGEEASIRIDQSKSRLEIVIADKGPGIPEAERERVFRPFVRGEDSRSRETGGTGLGLGIARNIARAHGGELILRSGKGGVGLEAVLQLPLEG